MFRENVTHEQQSNAPHERNQKVLCFAAGGRQEIYNQILFDFNQFLRQNGKGQ
jgi:hypothetical protein